MRRLFILLTLAGCTGTIDAPSLAPRPAEREPIDAPGDAVERATAADPVLTERLAPIVALAESGENAFQTGRRAAEAAVTAAAGAPAGSDRWLVAQQTLSALEAMVGPTRDAARAIDALRAEPANSAPGNRAAIDVAAARVDEIDAAQRATLAALNARLG